MTAIPERGFLLIADLTGYTAYLSRGEIEHAPTIAGDLLETIVGRLEPPFRLAKLEGDAAFLYVEDGRADGSLLLDAVEAAYIAFRRRLRSIEQATSCECQACRQAPRLDLKLFVHHGQYVRTTIAGRDELAGSSVIVVHRLLKGAAARSRRSVEGRAPGLAVITADALAASGFTAEEIGATTDSEDIEHVGLIVTHSLDLEARWQSEAARARIVIDDHSATIDVEVVVPGDPATIWAYLTSPTLRPAWEGPISIVESTVGGRRGVGTQAQCVSGRLATLEEIVDWQPYDHVAYRLAVPDLGPIEASYDLAGDRAQTTIRLRWAASPSEQPREDVVARIHDEKQAALARLGKVVKLLPTAG